MSEAVLIDLQTEIVFLTHEVNEIGKTIKHLDHEFEDTQSEESRTFLFETIELYKTRSEKLRILLEAYFAEERNLGVPTDFLMRRLYKKITA